RAVNTIWLTAALFHTLVDIDVRAFIGLKQLLVGGDVVSPDHIRRIYAADPNVVAINGYGPTENTTFSCCFTIPRDWSWEDALPLGKAINGTQVCLLSKTGTPVAKGCVGEIVVTGLGVANGYLEPTQETGKFYDLRTSKGSYRAYRTGDLGYEDSNGLIRFLGRADQQVKINGFRVELEAIDRVLTDQVNVSQSVTLAIKQGNIQQLVSFVIVEQVVSNNCEVGELRSLLATILPVYMVPNVILALPLLPVTSNGKVDRKLLLEKYFSWQMGGNGEQRPFTIKEQQVADVWLSVLGTVSLGPQSHFFQVGGNSLLALKIASRLEQRLGQKINLIDLIKRPVLEQLAAFLEEEWAPQSQSIPYLSITEKTSGVPISVQQWSLWPLYKMGRAAEYNVLVSYDLLGHVNVPHLSNALYSVYCGFDALHSQFIESGEHVLMAPCVHKDWSATVTHGDEALVQSLYKQELQRDFDLTSGPVFIAHIVSLSLDHHILIMNFPHIVIDGWSIEQLWLYIDQSYQQLPQTTPKLGFCDYLGHSANLPSNVDYWLQRLQGYQPFQWHSASPLLVQDASNRRFLLSERDTSALQHRAEKEQTSLFCTALYLWAQTVAEYTGQNDVVVSTPYANREHRQLLSLVGYLVAMVPVRYQQGMRLTDFQQELHQDFVAAQCDFNALLPSLGLNTEGGRHPLQQTVFSWQDGLLSKPSLADLSVKYRESEATGAKFPLSLSISPNGGSYELKWDYDPLIISTNTLLLIEDLFLTKLRSQTTPWPKRTVIPADNNVLDALYQQVEERGKTIAVYAGSEHLSYDQLWCQARRLAAQLQHLGVKAGDKVGVRLSRNCNLSIALVGIVMAGAIYVPLADDESSERLLILIKQSQMTLCLSDAPVSPSISCWFVDELLTAPELEYRNVSLSGHSPIYVNFSSGTTGEPKGILCTHQGVYRLVKEADYISLSSNTRMLCAAIPTFDAFTLEFWGPLLNGGALHMLMKPQLDCGALKDFIQVDGVNTLWLTAALFHTLVDIDVNAFLGGRQLLVGGDVVSPDHVRRVYAADHNIEIVNGYGPTENTTFTCCYRIPRDWPVDEALPIGYPVNGTQVYILDKTAQPVAAGCIGEIVVIGQGLAAGYLNPTQEEGRFITLQTPEGVCRAYCTGDLGYVDAMGRVRFIGRADQQVKINGFRVELEAINRVLSGLHEVCRGETLAFKQNDVQHLVSFVQREDSNEEVYEALDLIPDIAKVLPSYMVPRTVLALDHLPMTHNGKVDRKKLMTVYLEWSQNRELLHPIETDTERLIADVWQDVLGPRIQGRQSHFYQSGGNSIMLLKVHAILMDRLEREIPLNLCLQHVILYELAHVIDLLLQPTEIYDPEIEIKEGISYPLSNEQLRLYLTQQLYPGTAYNVPCYIRLPKNIQMSQVRHLIISLLEAHPALRMRISEEKGEIKQCLLAPSDVVITWLNTSHLSFFALKEQISLETIEVDVCVSRIQVIDVEGEEVWLALNIHHIGIDGQSINTLLESIDTILSGKSLALDDGFIRHVMWQKSEEYESAVAQEVVYWRERLSSLSAPTVLPYLEMPNASHKAAYVDMVLDTRLITGAERLSRRLGVSEFTLWSGILSLVLGRLNQTTFATIATPVAKRLHRTESKSIGFFANTLMLYSKWSDNLRVDDFLKSRQQLITRDLCHPLVALDTLLLLQKEQEKQIDTLSEVLFTLTRPDDASRINMGRNSDVKFHFGLTLSLGNTEALAQIEYLECAYNEAMIYSVLDALIWCVEQIIADPGILIGDIKLIQDEPKTLQQEEVKQTKCLPELIMQVAKLQPNAIALSDKDEQIDYETLVKLANQIGASLQEMGVKKGDRVAVLISRRAVLPVTLLGILLAGAVYVPLDPEYPLARNQYILEDARPRIVIYESQRLISNSFPFEWLSLSELESVSPNNTWHPVKIEEDDVSHLIYTSGSTGSPKGVVIRHGGVSALQSWASDTYKREDLALVYGATSICFDLSVFEIFITWSLGGRLHFANNALQL
ncbi:AMP-binding protein, partial [Shewanella sp.]